MTLNLLFTISSIQCFASARRPTQYIVGEVKSLGSRQKDTFLKKIRNIRRHLNNLRGVKLFNVTKIAHIIFGQKIIFLGKPIWSAVTKAALLSAQ